MVYFVQGFAPGFLSAVKIGVANNVDSRLRELQSCSPIPLVVLATIEGDQAKETQLHRWFKHLRLHGEWFAPADELLGFIARQIHEKREYLGQAEAMKIAREIEPHVVELKAWMEFQYVFRQRIASSGKRVREKDSDAILKLLLAEAKEADCLARS